MNNRRCLESGVCSVTRSSVRVITMAVNMLTATPMNSVSAKPITGAEATIDEPSQ